MHNMHMKMVSFSASIGKAHIVLHQNGCQGDIWYMENMKLILENTTTKHLCVVPLGCLRLVIVIFPDHTHLLFLIHIIIKGEIGTLKLV